MPPPEDAPPDASLDPAAFEPEFDVPVPVPELELEPEPANPPAASSSEAGPADPASDPALKLPPPGFEPPLPQYGGKGCGFKHVGPESVVQAWAAAHKMAKPPNREIRPSAARVGPSPRAIALRVTGDHEAVKLGRSGPP